MALKTIQSLKKYENNFLTLWRYHISKWSKMAKQVSLGVGKCKISTGMFPTTAILTVFLKQKISKKSTAKRNYRGSSGGATYCEYYMPSDAQEKLGK